MLSGLIPVACSACFLICNHLPRVGTAHNKIGLLTSIKNQEWYTDQSDVGHSSVEVSSWVTLIGTSTQYYLRLQTFILSIGVYLLQVEEECSVTNNSGTVFTSFLTVLVKCLGKKQRKIFWGLTILKFQSKVHFRVTWGKTKLDKVTCSTGNLFTLW